MRVTNREFKPAGIGLGADDDKFLHLKILQHAAAVLRKKQVQIEGRRGTELERLQYLHTSLRAALENEASPARDLSLPDACPAAPEIRAGQIDKIRDRRWLRTEEPDPGANDQRAGAMDDDVKAILQKRGMLLEERTIESSRDIRDGDGVIQADITREVDFHDVIRRAQTLRQIVVDVPN